VLLPVLKLVLQQQLQQLYSALNSAERLQQYRIGVLVYRVPDSYRVLY
jgi:hypothetical protein